MGYNVKGQLLEVCTCNILCPCWVGEDPDGGTCDGVLAWHYDEGQVNGIDVAGRTFVILTHIPGNILKGNFRVIVFVDDRATPQQEQALTQAFSGKLGGPLADFAQLFGEVVGVQRSPITFAVEQGKGHLQIGTDIDAELEPYLGTTGAPTTLHDTIFSTIAGAPAYVGKAPKFKMANAALDINVDIQNHNAIQGSFLFEG